VVNSVWQRMRGSERDKREDVLALRSAAEAWARASRSDLHAIWCRCHEEGHCIQNIVEIGCNDRHPYTDPRCAAAREPQP
jgi:hypothetical protein